MRDGDSYQSTTHVVMNLEGYLDELRQAGALDSHGRFTLDQARALEKLRRYQVDNPEWYSLALVSSAVAAQASRIDLECSYGRFFMRHDGRSFSFEELATLFSSLVLGGTDPRQAPSRELATGLNALGKLSPRSVRVISSDSKTLVTLSMDPQNLLVGQDPSGGFESYSESGYSTTVEVLGVRRSFWSRIMSWAQGALPEVKALRQRCRFAPVPVFLGEELLNPDHSLASVTGVLTTGDAGRLPVRFGQPLLQLERQAPGPFEGFVALVPETPSSITLVVRGISFEVGHLDLPEQGLRAVIQCSELAKDLSQTRLIEGESYEEVLRWTREAVEEILLGLVEVVEQVPGGRRLAAADLMDSFARAYLKTWKGELASKILVGVRALRKDSKNSEQLRAWADSYDALGLKEESSYYRQRSRSYL